MPRQMRRGLAVAVLAFSTLLPRAAAAQAKTGEVSIGTRYTFTVPGLQGEIPVRIHLPAARSEAKDPPPALYVLEIADDFVYASATADFLAHCGRIPGLVVVGIDVDKLSGPPRAMIDFLDKELIPFVEKTAGAGPRRILFGHSGRSFAALFILLERPDLFEGFICPGLGLTWPLEPGRMDFTALAEQRWAKIEYLPKSLLFSLGDEDKFYAGIDRFIAMLEDKAPAGLRWKYLHLTGEDHESTKLQTLYRGLEFVLGQGLTPASLDGRWAGTARIRTDDGQENNLSLVANLELAPEGLKGSIGPSEDAQFAIGEARVEGRTVSFWAAMPTRIYAIRATLDEAGDLAGELRSADGRVTGSLRLSKRK